MSFTLVPTLAAHKIETLISRCWDLHVACSACKKGRVWTPAGLAAFPPDATVGDVLARLVCSCGSRDGVAALTQNQGELQRRDVERFEGEGKYEG